MAPVREPADGTSHAEGRRVRKLSICLGRRSLLAVVLGVWLLSESISGAHARRDLTDSAAEHAAKPWGRVAVIGLASLTADDEQQWAIAEQQPGPETAIPAGSGSQHDPAMVGTSVVVAAPQPAGNPHGRPAQPPDALPVQHSDAPDSLPQTQHVQERVAVGERQAAGAAVESAATQSMQGDSATPVSTPVSSAAGDAAASGGLEPASLAPVADAIIMDNASTSSSPADSNQAGLLTKDEAAAAPGSDQPKPQLAEAPGAAETAMGAEAHQGVAGTDSNSTSSERRSAAVDAAGPTLEAPRSEAHDRPVAASEVTANDTAHSGTAPAGLPTPGMQSAIQGPAMHALGTDTATTVNAADMDTAWASIQEHLVRTAVAGTPTAAAGDLVPSEPGPEPVAASKPAASPTNDTSKSSQSQSERLAPGTEPAGSIPQSAVQGAVLAKVDTVVSQLIRDPLEGLQGAASQGHAQQGAGAAHSGTEQAPQELLRPLGDNHQPGSAGWSVKVGGLHQRAQQAQTARKMPAQPGTTSKSITSLAASQAAKAGSLTVVGPGGSRPQVSGAVPSHTAAKAGPALLGNRPSSQGLIHNPARASANKPDPNNPTRASANLNQTAVEAGPAAVSQPGPALPLPPPARKPPPTVMPVHPDIDASFNRSRLDAMTPTLLKLKLQRRDMMKGRNNPRPTNDNIITDSYLAMCTIVKDEHELLYEWIMYHHVALGIKRFYVFEHASKSSALPMLMPLVQSGVVVYEYFVFVRWDTNNPGSPQVWAYNECMRRWGTHHAWMGLLDVDEFLVVPNDDMAQRLRTGGEDEALADAADDCEPAMATMGSGSIVLEANFSMLPQPASELEDLLYEYEGAGALMLNWELFGSNGHVKRPPGVLGYFTKCTPYRTVKSIVSTYFFDRVRSPHHCSFTHGAIGVDVDGEEVVEGHTSVIFKPHRLVVHHYFLRSAQDWMDKVQRRGAWSGSQRPMHYFDQVNREIEQFERMFPMAFAALKCDSLAAQYKDRFTIQLGKQERAEDPEELAPKLGRGGGTRARGRIRTRVHRRRIRARAVDGIARIPTAWAGADDAPKQAFSETGAFRRPRRAWPHRRPGAESAT